MKTAVTTYLNLVYEYEEFPVGFGSYDLVCIAEGSHGVRTEVTIPFRVKLEKRNFVKFGQTGIWVVIGVSALGIIFAFFCLLHRRKTKVLSGLLFF